ncbi:MAG: MBL fold metallo-hydrolase [Eubacteriales bacterium]|nr:MBL fold metallo-hydrolase [Eubacteriales bacterium]MDD4389367.1 MBL fold metallo-hydrolase [Eubacteriales bacterium]
MKLTVLVDNHTYIDQYYLGEPAVSYYIEEGDSKLLFDMGYSDILISNANKMGILLEKIDTIILSHGHNDHARGLKFLKEEYDLSEKTLIAHPGCFDKKNYEGEDIGAPFSVEEISAMLRLKLSKEPVFITPRLVFLGEIPMKNDFEEIPSIGVVTKDGKSMPDSLTEDTALAYIGEQGLFIITGCSHRGICNIAEHAKQVCGVQKISGVLGGFHLFENNERLTRTKEYFKDQQIRYFYPCHCVSLKAKIEMGKDLNIGEVGVGMQIIL